MTDEGYVDPVILEYGILPPDPENYDSPEAYTAAYNVWLSGFESYLNNKRAEEAKVEAARQAAEEAVRQAAAEEVVRKEEVREEESRPASEAAQLPDELPEPEDRYAVGSYIDAAGNVWSPAGELLSGEGGLTGSYVDQAGHLWSMEYSAPMEEQPQAEVVTGDPTIDTALLLLDLIDAITGEDGMTSDVDGIQQALDHPLMTTSFQDYTVTEGLLLLLLLSVFVAACARMLKEGFAWLR